MSEDCSRRLRQERALHTANINALITVGCVCWMFIISWIPYTVRILAQGQSVILPKWFYIFQAHVLRLNVVMNPIIYTCTNRSFKTCVKERILGKIFKSFRKPAGKQSSRFESTKRVQISSTWIHLIKDMKGRNYPLRCTIQDQNLGNQREFNARTK